ncbi:MAG: M1 family aminopeptidase [Alistipes indistinctus]
MAAGTETTGARKRISFHETEPIPTYLFSFVGGRFERVTENRNGRSISLYHRETDLQKTAQCPEILGQVFHALDWLETYTGVPYPFAKYDLIVIPGFQYGGMEHMGATLYADRSMFLENNATTENRMARGSLIAHETAHMWFGDYVTMQWFDDVWTKEVFANFFAAMIVREQFPQIDHRLNFIRSNVPGAYGEDRTAGSTAIRQQLPNLSDAGLLYSQIIYSKSPVVMEMLFTKLGPEKFRDGIREYLADHRYGNATWDDLIAVLDSRCDEDLAAWSRVWVDEKGMPTIDMTRHENRLRIMQSDPFGRRLAWNQPLQLLAFGDGNATDTLQCLLDGPETELVLPAGTRWRAAQCGRTLLRLLPAGQRHIGIPDETPDRLARRRGPALCTDYAERKPAQGHDCPATVSPGDDRLPSAGTQPTTVHTSAHLHPGLFRPILRRNGLSRTGRCFMGDRAKRSRPPAAHHGNPGLVRYRPQPAGDKHALRIMGR